VNTMGKTMLQGGGTFGTFMAIGTGIRCWMWQNIVITVGNNSYKFCGQHTFLIPPGRKLCLNSLQTFERLR
jgi:hypothetical protein